MTVPVLHSFSVMELWLRALGEVGFACQGAVPWLHIPRSFNRALCVEGAWGLVSSWQGCSGDWPSRD